ncbi:hypothetical protein HYDPIDRAFT_114100 [Hydnomerulius pinastri MD-312]|uniref:Uncharacterized protein n=1 Tax=Hydnomerulius pinastri MD-312 TaxID=994086 RepID=A0A0C9WE21_9AGAM|nr:hypothetical protein HYDPIDRAFT_114100 [Hydnomerulius pinastri MD-312]
MSSTQLSCLTSNNTVLETCCAQLATRGANASVTSAQTQLQCVVNTPVNVTLEEDEFYNCTSHFGPLTDNSQCGSTQASSTGGVRFIGVKGIVAIALVLIGPVVQGVLDAGW